jgi:hypothetical protein
MAAIEARLNSRLDGIEAKVVSGFNAQRQLSLELQTQGNEAYAKTMHMFEMFGKMMTGGAAMASRPELPAPLMRPAICAPATTPSSSVTEVHEEKSSARSGGFANEAGGELKSYMHSCFYTNEVGRYSISSSQRSQSGAACGGGSAQSFYREPVPTATSRTSTPKFDAAAARWNLKKNSTNGKILQAIRDTTPDDNMRCLLLALVNGKTYSEITNMYDNDVASLLTTGNTSFFQNFFTALTKCGVPSNFDVKVDASKTKTGHGFVMTYLQLSQAPGHVDRLVTTLRAE